MNYYNKRILNLLECSYGFGVEDEMEDGNRSVAAICFLGGIESILYFYMDVTELVFPCTSIPARVLTDRMLLRLHQFCDLLTTNGEMAGFWTVEESGAGGVELKFLAACPTQLPPEVAAFAFARAMKQADRQTQIVRQFTDQVRQAIIPSLPKKTEV